MIKDGRLDILSDRLHFIDKNAVEHYLDNAQLFYERVLEYFIENRPILRILTYESLRCSKHHNVLFGLMDFIKSDDSPFYKNHHCGRQGFQPFGRHALFKFFYAVIPTSQFAAYYDDYKEISKQNDHELRSSFLRSFRLIIGSLVKGNDFLYNKL